MSIINSKNKEKLDGLLTYLVVKNLVTPVAKSKAFKLGLVDNTGIIIRQPESQDEKDALGTFEKFMFKMKRMLGSKVSQLNNFMYLQSIEKDFFNNMIVTGNVDKRAEVTRIKRDMENIIEKYDTNYDEVMKILISEKLSKDSIKKKKKKMQNQLEESQEQMKKHRNRFKNLGKNDAI